MLQMYKVVTVSCIVGLLYISSPWKPHLNSLMVPVSLPLLSQAQAQAQAQVLAWENRAPATYLLSSSKWQPLQEAPTAITSTVSTIILVLR